MCVLFSVFFVYYAMLNVIIILIKSNLSNFNKQALGHKTEIRSPLISVSLLHYQFILWKWDLDQKIDQVLWPRDLFSYCNVFKATRRNITLVYLPINLLTLLNKLSTYMFLYNCKEKMAMEKIHIIEDLIFDVDVQVY